LIGGIALIGLAAFLFTQAIPRIVLQEQLVKHEPVGFIAVGYTLAVDFFRIGTLWGRGEDSVTVKASLYHAFADFASTTIALLGFGLTFIGGDDRIDATASIVLGSLLIYLTIGLIRTSSAELSDAIPKRVVTEVRREILRTKNVLICRDLRVRRVGSKTYVETTICVPSSMGLTEAHDVASQIETRINELYGDVSVTVHVEPVGFERPIKKQIESLATGVEGVKSVHNLSSVYSKGKLFVTLHATVDPDMPLEKAHNIAEKIEDDLKRAMNNIENVTVHIEPYTPKIQQGSLANGAQIRKTITQIVTSHPNIKGVRKVVTYVSDKRRYINIDCSFNKSVSVEAMHDTVSHVENEIKNRFREAVITIHAEPAL
jgi:cation diffusion facilitator family transporter